MVQQPSDHCLGSPQKDNLLQQMIISSWEAQGGRAGQQKEQSEDGEAGDLGPAPCSATYLLCTFRQVTYPLWASTVIWGSCTGWFYSHSSPKGLQITLSPWQVPTKGGWVGGLACLAAAAGLRSNIQAEVFLEWCYLFPSGFQNKTSEAETTYFPAPRGFFPRMVRVFLSKDGCIRAEIFL